MEHMQEGEWRSTAVLLKQDCEMFEISKDFLKQKYLTQRFKKKSVKVNTARTLLRKKGGKLLTEKILQS